MNCRHVSRFLVMVEKGCHNHKLQQAIWQNEPNFLLAFQWDGIQRRVHLFILPVPAVLSYQPVATFRYREARKSEH